MGFINTYFCMQVDLAQTITLLKNGKVVAIPTETVYGLAADATCDDALRQIYAIKERPADNPLIVHIASSEQVDDWASAFSELAKKLALAFWPGPFTLVLPAKETVSNVVRSGEPTVALRVPAHTMTQQVLKESGLGLAAPSANKYTQLSPTTAAHVVHGLGDAVPVLDGGACDVGIESTIVAVDGDDWRLLRLGMISEAAIEDVAGKQALQNDQPLPKAPGQHLLHYSPRTPMYLFADSESLAAFAKTQSDCAVLAPQKLEVNAQLFLLPDSPTLAAENLYGLLHQMDALNKDCLLVQMPPDGVAWLPIRDRLNRAAYKS